ncbi:MAG: serine/threonine protein kinase [Pseudomonadota bacterium]|nr:serine/threonine protein kinase [Pseudomonadota bacterium]
MDSSALSVGARVGEMQILRVIAVGGFGIVYLARDHSLDRDVALKEFMPSRLVGRKDGERVTVRSVADARTFELSLKSFVNEAKLLAKFSHPAVVKVYRFWEANGTAYMAMPYLRGPTLKNVRRSMTDPPTETWLRSVIDPLLDALAMLHAEGFYHRDIAPDNVLLSGTGLPVLLDFGAARHLIGDRTQSLTAVLKPNYAPIEQYAESRQLRQGPWTDLYALGALIKYLLDGSPPPASTARSIHDEMDALADRRIADVSTRFLAAIDWALAVRPQDRPQNVDALRAALSGRLVPPLRDSARQGGTRDVTGLAPESESVPPTLLQPRAVPRRRSLALPEVLAIVGVAVAVAAAWALSGLVSNSMAPAPSELATAQRAAQPAARPVEASEPPPPVVRVVASTATSPVYSPEHEWARRPLVQQRVESGAGVHAAAVKTRAPPSRKFGQKRKAATTQIAAIGPVELCAGHNFFMRAFCVRRRCDEPRFSAHAECMQARQAVRTQRDY